MCGAAVSTLVAEMQAVKQELADSSKRIAVKLPGVAQTSVLAVASARKASCDKWLDCPRVDESGCRHELDGDGRLPSS